MLLTLAIIFSGFSTQNITVKAEESADAPAPLIINTPQKQTLTYELYAGGINAVRAELDIEYKAKDEYRLFLSAWTQKLLGRLVPWNGTFESYGWTIADGTHKPEMHESISNWRKEKEIKTYSYNKDGTFNGITIIEEGVDKSPKELPDELVQQTIDALTATLYVLEDVGAGETCSSSAEVFDGKRRFELVFNHEETEMLKPTKYNIYEGAAARCTVEVQPVSGKWHSKPRGWISIQEQGRDKGKMPTIWIAKVSENAPAVPVKMRIKTDYGTLFMHLVEYDNGEKTLKARKS